ncbi:MAG: hypothetical protein ACYSW4_02470, partial [Planctomycetota bacterium]
QDVNCMMKHADLKTRVGSPAIVKTFPLVFGNLTGPNDTDDHYQNLHNNYRQVNQEPNEVYCRGTINSSYIFLQYWHFEPSSSIAESTNVYHEGDWEMFQIAVEPNTTDEELQPFSITASQHYYGQTIRWDSNGSDNGPESQDQDYVDKSVHQPKVYVALNSHATYFRQGDFRVRTGGENHGDQYAEAPTFGPPDDATGGSSYSYTLRIFHDSMISHWQGNWGQDGNPFLPHDDGPRSPSEREVHSSPYINIWTNPKDFNNYYLKLKDYSEPPDPDNRAHPEIYIP